MQVPSSPIVQDGCGEVVVVGNVVGVGAGVGAGAGAGAGADAVAGADDAAEVPDVDPAVVPPDPPLVPAGACEPDTPAGDGAAAVAAEAGGASVTDASGIAPSSGAGVGACASPPAWAASLARAARLRSWEASPASPESPTTMSAADDTKAHSEASLFLRESARMRRDRRLVLGPASVPTSAFVTGACAGSSSPQNVVLRSQKASSVSMPGPPLVVSPSGG
jgi:hypothetical protein